MVFAGAKPARTAKNIEEHCQFPRNRIGPGNGFATNCHHRQSDRLISQYFSSPWTSGNYTELSRTWPKLMALPWSSETHEIHQCRRSGRQSLLLAVRWHDRRG